MNTILLFQEKKLINDDIFVNHPTFHFGRVVYFSHDVFNIEFLNAGVKKILGSHINRLLSRDVMARELVDYLFASKFIRVNNEYGKIIETFSNRVNVDFGSRKENYNIIFDESLTKVEFEFSIVDEEEYNAYIEEIEDKIRKENEKYLGIKVKHSKYGEGEVVSCENDKVTIKFIEKTTMFLIEYMLNNMEILNTDVKPEKVEEKSNVSVLNISVDDILLIPPFGRLFVKDYKPNTYIRVESIDSNVFGYNIEWLKEEYKVNNLDTNYFSGSLVYNEIYGFCIILGISNNGFDLYRIQDNTIVSLQKKYLNLLEKIIDNKICNLFKIGFKDLIKVNNILGTVIKFKKETFDIYSITDNQYLEIKYSDVKEFDVCNRNYNYIKSYRSAIYSIADKVFYNRDSLIKICLDAIKFFPVEDNIKMIKNNVNALVRKSGFLQVDKVNGIYMDERYQSLEEYLIRMAIKEDFIYKDSLLDSQYYEYLLVKMCKQHFIVQLYDNKFITLKKLAELDVNLLTFEDFKDKVSKCIENSSFVTISQIRENVDNILCTIFSDDNTLINLIKTYDLFKTYKLGNRYVLSIKNDVDRNKAIEKMFISLFEINHYTSMDIYDLLDVINDSYDFDFSLDMLLIEIKNFTILHYSKETERVYINKQQFYKEIYE